MLLSYSETRLPKLMYSGGIDLIADFPRSDTLVIASDCKYSRQLIYLVVVDLDLVDRLLNGYQALRLLCRACAAGAGGGGQGGDLGRWLLRQRLSFATLCGGGRMSCWDPWRGRSQRKDQGPECR